MDKIKDLGLEVVEVIVDNREFSEAIKDFPILRTISAANDIRNAIFISKLKSFLKPLKDIPKEKIKNEISKIDTSEKYRKKIGHNLINLIDRSFEEENSENIAILFRAFINNEISYEDFIIASRVLIDIGNGLIEYFVSYASNIKNLKNDKGTGYEFIMHKLINFFVEDVYGVITDYQPPYVYEDSRGKAFESEGVYSNEVVGGETHLTLSREGHVILKVFKYRFGFTQEK